MTEEKRNTQQYSQHFIGLSLLAPLWILSISRNVLRTAPCCQAKEYDLYHHGTYYIWNCPCCSHTFPCKFSLNFISTQHYCDLSAALCDLSTVPPWLPREVTMSSLMTYNWVRTPYGAHHLARPGELWTNAARFRVHIQTPGVWLFSLRHDGIHGVRAPKLVYWKGSQIKQDPIERLPTWAYWYDVYYRQ